MLVVLTAAITVGTGILIARAAIEGVKIIGDLAKQVGRDIKTRNIERELQQTAKKYKDFQSEEAAKAMRKLLDDRGERYEQVNIQMLPNCPLWCNSQDRVVATNGYHCGILYSGKAYCNVHPEGWGLPEWVNDFEGYTLKKFYIGPRIWW